MAELKSNSLVVQIKALLTCYGFDMRGYPVSELIQQWLNHYQAPWIRLAVIEALYQGRYKTISVEQILNCWLRLGHPSYHFNHEFECLVCRKFPRYLRADPSNLGDKQDEEQWGKSVNQEIVEPFPQAAQFSVTWEKIQVAEQVKEDDEFLTPSPGQESGVGTARGSIGQFTPSLDNSQFYSKLKAMTKLDLELAANLI